VFSSYDLRAEANTTPSTSLTEYVSETIDSLIQKQIAKAQTDCQGRVNKMYADYDEIVKKVMRETGEKKKGAMAHTDTLILNQETFLRKNCQTSVEALLGLRDYRMAEFQAWKDNHVPQESPTNENEIV